MSAFILSVSSRRRASGASRRRPRPRPRAGRPATLRRRRPAPDRSRSASAGRAARGRPDARRRHPRLSDEQPWDEATRPDRARAGHRAARYTPTSRSPGQHLDRRPRRACAPSSPSCATSSGRSRRGTLEARGRALVHQPHDDPPEQLDARRLLRAPTAASSPATTRSRTAASSRTCARATRASTPVMDRLQEEHEVDRRRARARRPRARGLVAEPDGIEGVQAAVDLLTDAHGLAPRLRGARAGRAARAPRLLLGLLVDLDVAAVEHARSGVGPHTDGEGVAAAGLPRSSTSMVKGVRTPSMTVAPLSTAWVPLTDRLRQ